MLLLEDKVKKFLDNLYILEDFSLEEDTDIIIGESDITSAMRKVFPHYDCDAGASKYVIWDYHTDYVFKIPFKGVTTITYEEYDPDLREWVDIEEPVYDFVPWYSDYCAIEHRIYNEAEDAGLGYLFAKVWIAGESTNHQTVYCQERIDCFGTVFYDFNEDIEKPCSHDSKEKAKTIISHAKHYCRISDEWLGAVVDMYGEEVAKKLLDFIDKKNINDLHSSNIGFRNNGEPVLIDYSGFYS